MFNQRDFLTNKGALRINVEHRGRTIRFGSIDLKKDCSIVFSSALLNDTSKYKNIEIGPQEQASKRIVNTGDIHVSLHPKGQIAHMRKQGTNEDLVSKNVNWFPVLNPFHFLIVRTPPIIDCNCTKKIAEITPVIESTYEDSLEFSFYVLPYEDLGRPFILKDEKPFLIGARHNQFQLYITYRFLNEKMKASILWREGDWFFGR